MSRGRSAHLMNKLGVTPSGRAHGGGVIWTLEDHTDCDSLIDALAKEVGDTSKCEIVCCACESAKRRNKRVNGQMIVPGSGTARDFMRFKESITTHPSWAVFECPRCGHRIEVRRKL